MAFEELYSHRTAKTARFIDRDASTKKEKVLRFETSPLPRHYFVDGAWRTLDLSPAGGRVHKCAYDVRLLENGIGYEGTDQTGSPCYLKLEGYDNPPSPIFVGNKVIWQSIDRDLDFELVFTHNGIKAHRILRSKHAPKTGDYTIQNSLMGQLTHRGWDARNHPIEMATRTGRRGRKSNTRVPLRQTVTGRRRVLDRVTRKERWEDELVYPVFADPTSTFSQTGTGNNGLFVAYGAWGNNAPYSASLYNNYGSYFINNTKTTSHATWGSNPAYRSSPWVKFDVSGIGASDTITEASVAGFPVQVYSNTKTSQSQYYYVYGDLGNYASGAAVPSSNKQDMVHAYGGTQGVGLTFVTYITTSFTNTTAYKDITGGSMSVTNFITTRAATGDFATTGYCWLGIVDATPVNKTIDSQLYTYHAYFDFSQNWPALQIVYTAAGAGSTFKPKINIIGG